MLSGKANRSGEQVSELADKLNRELIKEGPGALTARYAEALVVIEHMWNQYDSVPASDETYLSEEFVPEGSFPALFEEAMDNPIEKNPPHYPDFYQRCDKLYADLRPIADSVEATAGEKKKSIVKLSEHLHGTCAKEGGNIYRVITADVKFREQD